QTTVASSVTAPTSSDTAVPTLPATAAGAPAARCIAPRSSTVVVFPFVPVTATNSFGSSRHASSSSPVTGMSRRRASATAGARGPVGSLDRLLVQREPDRGTDRRDDPEAQDDLRLGPRHQLEVVVHRSHEEHPSSEPLEREHLDRDGKRLDHEDAADDQ